ncbi:MAG: triple tyrosine motif-containing protein [Nibricoccus sp.]
MRSRDGRIWFASRQGALAIDPDAEALAPRAPVVTIEQVKTEKGTLLVEPASPVQVDPGKLEIRFSVLFLAAPSRVQTHYRLVGFDNDWVDAGSSRSVHYPRLPPGNYRFEIVSGFGGPTAYDSRSEIEIHIARRWWQTSLVEFAGVAAGVGAIVILVRAWSHRRLRLRVERLERENAVATERARIARNIHDDVGASLTRISLLTQATASRSQDTSQLNRIYETASEITRSLDEIVWAIDPQDDTLESFVSYLTDFAQQFLDLAGVRCRLHIPASLPATALSSEVRHNLFLCCRELLNNVVKHAAADEVIIRLEFSPPELEIVIEDNGRGILLDGAMEPQADRVSTGHGVRNVAERIERLGGTMRIETPATGGTRVVLNVKIR